MVFRCFKIFDLLLTPDADHGGHNGRYHADQFVFTELKGDRVGIEHDFCR